MVIYRVMYVDQYQRTHVETNWTTYKEKCEEFIKRQPTKGYYIEHSTVDDSIK